MSALSSRYRSALVTGASGGLGRAFVEMLLAEGLTVAGTARDISRLKSLESRDSFHPLGLDLLHSESIERCFDEAVIRLGGFPDLVLNCAGYGVFGPFGEVSFDKTRDLLQSSLLGTIQVADLTLRQMLLRGTGCLVNVSSVAVDHPLPFMAGYNVTKSGLSALSESLIFETRGSGLVVVDFRPGDYRTPFNQSMEVITGKLPEKASPRLRRAWEVLEKNLAAAPEPSQAARDLRRALLRGKSGTYYSGGYFQTRLAPLFSRLAPANLRRAIAARYFGAA